jgi:hypothetical protein
MSRGVANPTLADKIGKKVEPVHMKHYGNEQVSIIRQSSIKSAVELMNGWIAKEEQKYNPKQIVELALLAAAEFEKWVLRDESTDSTN